MSSKQKKFDALVELALENGQVVDSFGDFDEKTGEGDGVKLVEHGGLWVVVESQNDEDLYEGFSEEQEAREAFAQIKKEIEEENDNSDD
ncbi:MAG: hypothetical protein PHC61_03875 [Chitinivibrionales bacterium]|nr:hypothetical protein [Chitinivibrionales bacterium]